MVHKANSACLVAGLLLILFWAVSALAIGPTEQVVYSFTTNGPNGASFPMVMDRAGNLFGTTRSGGPAQHGTIFELSPTSSGAWQETTLYNFGSSERPESGVILDEQGNLYGETDAGTIYELSPGGNSVWTITTLWTFSSAAGGTSPIGGLILDRAGNLYGAASTSGDLNCNIGGVGCGAIFKLVRNSSGQWNEYVLYRFHNPINGAQPSGPLVLDAKGNLYGTTFLGGDLSCQLFNLAGCGVVFELSPTSSGWEETVLYTFTAGDLNYPAGGLVRDAKGDLYGVGSGTVSLGAIFELSPAGGGNWTETTLHTFTGSPDGKVPNGGLLATSSGSILGTTSEGGVNDGGVIFQLSPEAGGGWSEHVLYTFGLVHADGTSPRSGLTPDGEGNFYGATAAGGANNEGTVFRLSK